MSRFGCLWGGVREVKWDFGGFGSRESFEYPLLGPFLVQFSGQDRAQSSPKTELGGHWAAGRRFLQNLHGASAGNTFLPSPGGRQRPKTGIRRALERLETHPEGALKGTLSRVGYLRGGVRGVRRDFGDFRPQGKFRATPSGPLFGAIFGPGSGPTQPQNRT